MLNHCMGSKKQHLMCTSCYTCDSVRNWGPLWGTSTFVFESYNGVIQSYKKPFAGTRYLPQQIFRSICRTQYLIKSTSFISSLQAADYVSKIVKGNQLNQNAQAFSNGTGTVVCFGRPVMLTLSASQKIAIENVLGQTLVIE